MVIRLEFKTTLERDFTARTLESVSGNIETLNANPRKNHSNGVKSICCFDQLEYFKAVNGLPPDIMHDLLEGIIILNFSLLMKHLISLKKLSINELNSKLNNFKYERIDKKNKFPKDIFKENSFDENSFSMTATHVWTLCKIFPLIIGEKLKDDILYMHFVSLLEIFQILNGDKFNENILQELEERIFQYLSEFKSLYNRPITAKLHFLLHYPRSIRNFGAPREFSTMRFESKHSYFKKVQQATHNHILYIYSILFSIQWIFDYILFAFRNIRF
jgi:hypothetical protein